jgi:hypothetical protein
MEGTALSATVHRALISSAANFGATILGAVAFKALKQKVYV